MLLDNGRTIVIAEERILQRAMEARRNLAEGNIKSGGIRELVGDLENEEDGTGTFLSEKARPEKELKEDARTP